jgi:hypothetical protein
MHLPKLLPKGTPVVELLEGYENALRSFDEFHKNWLRIPFHARDYVSSKDDEHGHQIFMQASEHRSQLGALLMELETYLHRHTVHISLESSPASSPEKPGS